MGAYFNRSDSDAVGSALDCGGEAGVLSGEGDGLGSGVKHAAYQGQTFHVEAVNAHGAVA